MSRWSAEKTGSVSTASIVVPRGVFAESSDVAKRALRIDSGAGAVARRRRRGRGCGPKVERREQVGVEHRPFRQVLRMIRQPVDERRRQALLLSGIPDGGQRV